MFNKLALLFAGLMLTFTSVGCCCLGGYGYGSGYGARGCAPCNNGCPPQGYYPQTGALYQGFDATQTAYVGNGVSTTAMAPISNGYTTTTASAAFPTTTAAVPSPIQGPPIYMNAGVPVNSLPPY